MARKDVLQFTQSLDVTNYLDYREYLKELYDRVKASVSPYSYLTFAEDLGFSATNVLRLVISGQRRLSLKSAQTIADGLELHHERRRFFLALVNYRNNIGKRQESKYFNEIMTLKMATTQMRADRYRLEYYSEWYHPVIREMIMFADFQDDPEWIASRLKHRVSTEEIKASLQLLQKLGIIEKNKSSGKFKLCDDNPMIMPSDATAGHLSIEKYHRTVLALAQESVSIDDDQTREFNALTLRISSGSLPLYKEKIRAFCSELVMLEQKERNTDTVAQFNVQLFPLTKNHDEKK